MKKGNRIPNKQIENLTQQGFCDKSFDVQKRFSLHIKL